MNFIKAKKLFGEPLITCARPLDVHISKVKEKGEEVVSKGVVAIDLRAIDRVFPLKNIWKFFKLGNDCDFLCLSAFQR